MSTLDHLRTAVRGPVLLAGDAGFEQARQPWNLAVAQPVSAVVEALDADDVASLVRYARDAGLTVTAQPHGHGATGDVDGLILLRTGRLDEVWVDPDARTARVGAGVVWKQLQEAASQHGLTGLPGSSPVVSVVGYVLGGGLSWFGRRYGWGSDSVRAFEIVDADGVRSRVTAASDPELFWALRGGGGDTALVTEVEIDLHPAPALYGGRMLWPIEAAPAVFRAFSEITACAPDELTVWVDLLRFPGSAPMVAVDATYLGDASTGQALLRPLATIGDLISDSRGVLPMAELGSVTDEPTDPVPGLSRAVLLTDLDDVTVKTLLSAPTNALLSVQVRHLGGALSHPSDSAAGPLHEPFLLYLFGVPSTPEAEAAVRTAQERTIRELAAHVGSRKPFTYLAPGETAAAAFTPDAMTRLREVKTRRDPRGVLRSNFPLLA